MFLRITHLSSQKCTFKNNMRKREMHFHIFFCFWTVLLHTGGPISKLKCNSILLSVFSDFFLISGRYKLFVPRFHPLGSEYLMNSHNLASFFSIFDFLVRKTLTTFLLNFFSEVYIKLTTLSD